MFNALKTLIQQLLIRYLGRDRLEYFASNTMNVVTQKLDTFIWSYQCQAKIIDIREETADTKTFVLLPNQHFKPAQAGQHIDVTINCGDEQLTRCYTLSAMDKATVSITIKRSLDGKVSNWFHDRAEIGMCFNISSAQGQFVYKGQRKVLLICAGSGITPGYAVLNDMLAQEAVPDIAFYYRSRTPALTIFRAPLAATGKVDFSYSQDQNSLPHSNVSLAQELAAYEDISSRHVYLCGPESFKNDVVKFLTSIDYDFEALEVEQFAPPLSVVEAQQCRNFDEGVTVYIKSQNIRFTIKAEACGETLLEAAEAEGIQMAYGCRTGMCGSCRTHLVSGRVTGNQLGKIIYPCSAYADSPELVLQ